MVGLPQTDAPFRNWLVDGLCQKIVSWRPATLLEISSSQRKSPASAWLLYSPSFTRHRGFATLSVFHLHLFCGWAMCFRQTSDLSPHRRRYALVFIKHSRYACIEWGDCRPNCRGHQLGSPNFQHPLQATGEPLEARVHLLACA